jgi:hypothetical protein
MIQGVTSGGRIGVAAIAALRYAQSDGRDIVMPVRPAELVYANFRHIQVRPDSRLEDGVPLYKLKILDTLIDHLAAERGAAESVRRGGAQSALPDVGGRSIDRMILEISSELRQGGAGERPYRARFLPEPGAFVNLLA